MERITVGELLIQIALAGMFGIYSIQDVKNKKISLFLLFFILPLLIIGIILKDKEEVISLFIGGGFGILLYLFSLCSGGRFGRGDAVVIGIAGLGMGFWKCLLLFFYGLLGAAVFSILLMVWKGYKKSYKIPLIPFLTVGYLIVLWI